MQKRVCMNRICESEEVGGGGAGGWGAGRRFSLYSRTSMAGKPMTRLPRLFRTRSWVGP